MKDNKYIFSAPEDKLNLIGAHFEHINSSSHLNDNTRLKVIIDNIAENIKIDFESARSVQNAILQFSDDNRASNPDAPTLPFHPFCDFLIVERILRNFPNKTSSGLDNIPPIILKHLPTILILHLTILFNDALNHSYFPKIWKQVKVLTILKKDKIVSDPASYRPISLTPSLNKVDEAIINDSISSFCSEHKIIPDCQFGFKYQHSTVHAIHKLMADINQQVEKRHLVGAALIDLEKTFDSVLD